MGTVSPTDLARDCILELEDRNEKVFEVDHDEDYGPTVEITRDGHEVVERYIRKAVEIALRGGIGT